MTDLIKELELFFGSVQFSIPDELQPEELQTALAGEILGRGRTQGAL